MAASSKRRLTRKEFKTNLKRQMEKRVPSQAQRHVTAYQIYMALHDLVFEHDAPISIDQVHQKIIKTDRTVSALAHGDLRREIMQTLVEGVVSDWCRCTSSGYFKPTSEPPEANDMDKNKAAQLAKLDNTNSENVKSGYVPPRNLVIHGEVSNEDEVPGFIVSVDEFVAFMKRVQENYGTLPPVKI